MLRSAPCVLNRQPHLCAERLEPSTTNSCVSGNFSEPARSSICVLRSSTGFVGVRRRGQAERSPAPISVVAPEAAFRQGLEVVEEWRDERWIRRHHDHGQGQQSAPEVQSKKRSAIAENIHGTCGSQAVMQLAARMYHAAQTIASAQTGSHLL